MEKEIIVGLDIGTTKIACFVGQRGEDGEKVKILGYGRTTSVGVEHGVVRNILTAADDIRRAVREASDQSNVDIDEVWVGIAGQHIHSRHNQGSIMIPPEHRMIEQSDLDRLIEEQHGILLDPGEVIVHVFPQTYFVDNEELSVEVSPVGVAGNNLRANFHIVTCNKDNLEHIKSAVEEAGLHIKGVVLEPVASAAAVLDDADRNAGVALVDIGGGTTDVAIFYENIIRHTSVLPLAGNAITNDIREGCQIVKNQAEILKTKFGSCLKSSVGDDDIIAIPGNRSQAPKEISMKNLAGIINARTQQILELVDYEIQLSGFSKKLIAGVVLTGGGARMRNIKELAELITRNNTRIGTPDEHLEHSDISTDELSHPMYATGIGLVLYGLAKTEERQRLEAEKIGHVDIFSNMDEQREEPKPEPQKTDEQPTRKKSKTTRPDRAIQDFLDKLFGENTIE
ncbi:MAG: cell division protein FtsA [Bacteroidales bacterium]|nr:cell division protein FtsA [Bacteroidales bacterium]